MTPAQQQALAHKRSAEAQTAQKRENALRDTAPEMLEALQAYEAWANKTICKDVELSGIRKQIRAAIARATGDTP